MYKKFKTLEHIKKLSASQKRDHLESWSAGGQEEFILVYTLIKHPSLLVMISNMVNSSILIYRHDTEKLLIWIAYQILTFLMSDSYFSKSLILLVKLDFGRKTVLEYLLGAFLGGFLFTFFLDDADLHKSKEHFLKLFWHKILLTGSAVEEV